MLTVTDHNAHMNHHELLRRKSSRRRSAHEDMRTHSSAFRLSLFFIILIFLLEWEVSSPHGAQLRRVEHMEIVLNIPKDCNVLVRKLRAPKVGS